MMTRPLAKRRDPLAAATAQTESQLVRAILDYLHARGCWAERRNSRVLMLPGKGGRLRPVRFGGMQGASDIIAIGLQGRFWAIEVKRPGQRPTPVQTWYLSEILRYGGLAMIATSVQDVADALERQL